MSHLKIVGASWVTCSKFHTEDPQILGATIKLGCLGFVHP